MFLHPSIAPTPRNFAHTNQSNPNTTWGGKFERQCMLATKPDNNFLIGDSHLERLSRPALSSLFQQHLSNWHNFGIGGDIGGYSMVLVPMPQEKCYSGWGRTTLKTTTVRS